MSKGPRFEIERRSRKRESYINCIKVFDRRREIMNVLTELCKCPKEVFVQHREFENVACRNRDFTVI